MPPEKGNLFEIGGLFFLCLFYPIAEALVTKTSPCLSLYVTPRSAYIFESVWAEISTHIKYQFIQLMARWTEFTYSAFSSIKLVKAVKLLSLPS